MAAHDPPRATNRHTRICLVGPSPKLQPASATRCRRSPTNFPRADHPRSAVAAIAVNRRGKSSAKSSGKKRDRTRDKNLVNSAQTRGSNRASRCNRRRAHLRLRHPLPQLPQPKLRLLPIKALPIWHNGSKRRCENRPAKHGQAAASRAQRLRPTRPHAARRCRHHRRVPHAPASKGPWRPRPARSIKTRRPSTIRSNKRWQICSGDRQRAEVGSHPTSDP
jgi:hypothetical protein